MTSEVINVGKVLREEAKARNDANARAINESGGNMGFKVSPKAVQEVISYLRADLDILVGKIILDLKAEGRTVILDRDIVKHRRPLS